MVEIKKIEKLKYRGGSGGKGVQEGWGLHYNLNQTGKAVLTENVKFEKRPKKMVLISSQIMNEETIGLGGLEIFHGSEILPNYLRKSSLAK